MKTVTDIKREVCETCGNIEGKEYYIEYIDGKLYAICANCQTIIGEVIT